MTHLSQIKSIKVSFTSFLAFKIFILSHMSSLLNVDEKIILIIFVIFNLFATVLICINLIKTPILYAVRAIGYARPLINILSVPIFYHSLESIGILINNPNAEATDYFLRILFIITSIFVVGSTTIFTFFFIKPLRHSNILWNYNNSQQFSHHVFTLLRCLVIYFDGFSIINLSVSLIIELHIYQMKPSYMNQKVNLIFNSKHALCVIINSSLILGYISKSQSLCFVAMITSCLFFIFVKIVQFMSAVQNDQEIPKCCFENCAHFYAFYLDLKTQAKNTSEDISKKINLHYLVCDSKTCIFNSANSENASTQKITMEDLEQKITKFLKSFRFRTPESELMYEIWKIELNKTISLSHNLRQFNLEHQFILQYVLGAQSSNKNQIFTSPSNNNLLNDSLSTKWKFYKQLDNAVEKFERLGDILCRPLPGLTEVVDIVIGIHHETEKLTTLFEEMVKNKDVNYICIQLYLKFFDCFLNKNKLSTDILDKLKRLRIITDSDFIEENPFPCFVVDSATQTIQRINSQALKFLKTHRHEIKDKKFNSLVIPAFNSKQIYAYSNKNKKQQLPIYFSTKSINKGTLTCRNIKLKAMQINNKNYYEITVHKKNYGSGIIDILINDKQQIIANSEPFITILFKQGSKIFPFEQFYEQKIKPTLKGISLLKVGRVEFDEECLVLGLIVEKFCPYPAMRLFTLNFIKKIASNRSNKRLSQARLSRLYETPNQFSFYYTFDENENAYLQGCQCIKSNQDSMINDNVLARTLNQKFLSFVSEITNQKTKNFSQNIKVYRLYKGDLYNIDLEDREKYQIQFDGAEEAFETERSWKLKVNENYLIAFLMILAILITGCSLFLGVRTDQSLDQIGKEETKVLYIQQFSLNYNRIMAVLRDVAFGIFQKFGKDYKPNVLDSYAELQNFDSSEFLSEKVEVGVYSGQQYQGSLSELIEVSLTHVYEYIQLSDNQIIEKIHDFALTYLGPLLAMEKSQKKSSIKQNIQALLNFSQLCFIFIVSGSVLYFVMYIVIGLQFKKTMNSFVEPILFTSDSEAKRISEECEKFKNVITNLYKNYEADVDSIGQKRDVVKKRNRPKRIRFGLTSMLTELIVGGLVVLSLLGLSLIQFTTIRDQLQSTQIFFKESEAVMQVYSGLSWITNQIDHLEFINFTEVAILSSHLDLIQNNKNGYQFSPKLTQAVLMTFFNNSCSYLVQNKIIDQSWCGDSMKGFTIKNPFRIGLDLYFRRINYNLIVNVTDTFGSNGIYSEPFKKLFKFFSVNIREEINQKLAQFRSSLLVLAILVSLMSFFLIIIFFVSVAYFKSKMHKVGKGLIDLIGDSLKKEVDEIDNKKQAQKQDKTLNEHIEQSDYLMLEQDGPDEVREQ